MQCHISDKQEPHPHLSENLGTQRTVVSKSSKALFTSLAAFLAFPASVVILHHHSWQSPDVPLLCGLWSLREIDVQNNPKHSGSFIWGDLRR
jgi:hypothetical protein